MIDWETRVIKLAGRSASKASEICDAVKAYHCRNIREQNGESLPLSAFINKTRVHSFDYSKDEWNKLKQDRSSLDIKMTCCENRGILKQAAWVPIFLHIIEKVIATPPPKAKNTFWQNILLQKRFMNVAGKHLLSFKGKQKIMKPG